jgi:hypothetical protein
MQDDLERMRLGEVLNVVMGLRVLVGIDTWILGVSKFLPALVLLLEKQQDLDR